MPTYEYRCKNCNALYESEKSADEVVCRTPGCSERAVRVWGRVNYNLNKLKEAR